METRSYDGRSITILAPVCASKPRRAAPFVGLRVCDSRLPSVMPARITIRLQQSHIKHCVCWRHEIQGCEGHE